MLHSNPRLPCHTPPAFQCVPKPRHRTPCSALRSASAALSPRRSTLRDSIRLATSFHLPSFRSPPSFCYTSHYALRPQSPTHTTLPPCSLHLHTTPQSFRRTSRETCLRSLIKFSATKPRLSRWGCSSGTHRLCQEKT